MRKAFSITAPHQRNTRIINNELNVDNYDDKIVISKGGILP